MNNPLQLLKDRHSLDLSDTHLQAIVNTCAEIIVIQEQEEQDQGNAEAAEALGFFDEEQNDCMQCGVEMFGDNHRGFCSICR